MKAIKIFLLILLVLLLVLLGLLLWQLLHDGTLPEVLFPSPTPAPPEPGSLSAPPYAAGEGDQALLEQAYAQLWSWETAGDPVSDGEQAVIPVRLTLLHADALAGSGARDELLQRLAERVGHASRRREIYDEQGQYYPELIRDCYDELLRKRLEHPEDFGAYWDIELRYTYTSTGWELQNGDELYPFRPDAEALYASATADLPLFQISYSIPEDALCGNEPDLDGYLLTDDPSMVQALLERPEAKALIGEETLVWNPDIPFVPGTLIRCYLDESLLVLLWQEPEHDCMGTFAEIFVADGSQLRRKISRDTPWSLWFEKTTEFAVRAKAVLAVSGDFYYHDRNCGVAVYQREILRFRPDNADSCFITADGDMLFLYRGAGLSREELEQYLIDNNVVFSLAFGPVLVDEGLDVTPDFYPWGEIDDYYARSALGLLGRHHYLTMNINCDTTRPELDHLPNLRDAANAMIKRGCWKAYTLDGGQTASTAFHYQLINPVQYGREKPISDIIYFASAVPEN